MEVFLLLSKLLQDNVGLELRQQSLNAPVLPQKRLQRVLKTAPNQNEQPQTRRKVSEHKLYGLPVLLIPDCLARRFPPPVTPQGVLYLHGTHDAKPAYNLAAA